MKHYIDCHVPIYSCNLKCPYCYVTQLNISNKGYLLPSHSIDEFKKATTIEKMGGHCLFNLCGLGETLLMPGIVEYIKTITMNGHFVMLVTNGICFNKLEEITKLDHNILEHIFIKFSFHYEQLKNLKLLDRFFSQITDIRKAGASFTLEMVPYDELIPEINRIKKVCLEKLGALPHITIPRDHNKDDLPILTALDKEEFYKVWSTFNSKLFDFKYQIFNVKRKEFCYAGLFSAHLNLLTGDLEQCYQYRKTTNIYTNKKTIRFPGPICRCKEAHCYNGHSWLAFGDIQEIPAPSYYELRNRHSTFGYDWVSEQFFEIFNYKFKPSMWRKSFLYRWYARINMLSNELINYSKRKIHFFLKK